MKIKNMLSITSLIVLMGVIGGCHYGVVDRYRDYGDYRSDNGSYREGYRDGRAYERRREIWRDRRDRDDRRWGRG